MFSFKKSPPRQDREKSFCTILLFVRLVFMRRKRILKLCHIVIDDRTNRHKKSYVLFKEKEREKGFVLVFKVR